MAATKALVKPALLLWARDRSKVRVEDAAKAANVDFERLQAWERGDDAPTIGQLRLLAAKYHFPLAVFYLPEPPADFMPLRDFRRLPEADDATIAPNLAFHIRSAYERRELALELASDLRSEPRPFPLEATVNDDPEKVGQALRDFLGVDDDSQQQAARQGRGFDFWRRRMEESDILVFVVSGPHYAVELKQMRGFAIARSELPVIVVNGRDYSQGGKAFTLLHELAHIVLGESAISNDSADDMEANPDEQRIERFCDAVAGAALMPRGLVQSVSGRGPAETQGWSDDELRNIARGIGVSREALLVRFVSLGRATWDFYRERRAHFQEEYQQAEAARKMVKGHAPIKRSIMLMNWNGRSFTRLVLRSYYDQRITLNDVSNYLGAKVRHIPALERATFRIAE